MPTSSLMLPPASRKVDSLATINLDGIRKEPSDTDSDGDDDDVASNPSVPSLGSSFQVADDSPPHFPSINSAQRQSASSSKPVPSSKLSNIQSAPGLAKPANRPMPPPAPRYGGGGLAVLPSTSALTAPPGVGGASGATLNKAEKRNKVALAPGCSPLDWARLKKSTDLRGGVTTLLPVTPSQLKKHNTKQDAWSAFYGKVYNITPYLRFHPGGEDDLMRVAGRDGTRLFALTHSWVNIDAMIDSAMVGILSSE